MNAIATQFPELPTPAAVLERTWRATWFVGESKLNHCIEKHAVYTADQMHQYARDYAASQTAGGPPGWKLVPVEPTPAMVSAFRSAPLDLEDVLYQERLISGVEPDVTNVKQVGPAIDARLFRKSYAAMLAAAPASSGGEFVNIPRELTPSMLEAAEQEEACGNDFPDMWEAAIATYLFDKENGNG